MNRSATTQVYVTEDGDRRLVTSKREIEQACINENLARFTQSHGTPLTVEPMRSALGLLADTEIAQDILNGTWEPPDEVDVYTKLLLKEMKVPDALREAPPMDYQVSVGDHTRGWNKQKERISSAPSGLHFGHYKAGVEDEDIASFDATIDLGRV